MTGRPETLFPLFAGLESLTGIGPKSATHFAQMHVEKPRDLLFTLPHSVIDRRRRATLRGVEIPAVITVEVTIGAHQPPRARGRPYRVAVEDAEEGFSVVFFHAKPDYLQRILPTGQRRLISGRVEYFDGVVQMVHPDHILRLDEADALPDFEAVYPLTAGVTQKQIRRAAASAVASAPALAEWIDPQLLSREGWPSWLDALVSAHNPKGLDFLDSPSRKRLAYDEFFAHQLTLALARSRSRARRGVASVGGGHLRKKIIAALPYKPTRAQHRAADEIAADMAATTRMNRLLQGDVGAGKTLVALLALLVAVEAGGQGVMMAPTEILARQHLAGLQSLVARSGVQITLLTGRDKAATRREKLAALAKGDIDILVGTHAVFQPDVTFHDLRLAVVDEQHRFGVRQRQMLGEKGRAVDVLVMTATPIPRSLTLAQYGDMDISILDEKPAGRKPIKTAMVSTSRLAEVFDHLKTAIAAGQQAYWVCPLVEESETLDYTAAEERFKSLRAAFGDGEVALVHGQMASEEKDAAMAAFQSGKAKLLVATTVIEVGVDVPAASIMVIERAESFGLAQLHQLRGRVGRGNAESTCLLLYQAPLSESARLRLSTLRDTDDGFHIAEVDLQMRGAGDVLGHAQSGLPQFRIGNMEGQPGLMTIARDDARKLLNDDAELKTPRGQAARVLLWLLEQDRAISLLSVG